MSPCMPAGAVRDIDKNLAIVLVGVVTVLYTNFVHALIKYLGILFAVVNE